MSKLRMLGATALAAMSGAGAAGNPWIEGGRRFTTYPYRHKYERLYLKHKAKRMHAMHRWGHRRNTTVNQRIANLFKVPNPPGTKLAKKAARGKIGIQ